MIYNSNGNNIPYQNGGNARLAKEVKALEDDVRQLDSDFTELHDAFYSFEPSITGQVETIENEIDRAGTGIKARIDTLETKTDDYATSFATGNLTATNGDFQKLVCAKYNFQNAVPVTGQIICKVNPGSIIWATDGTNCILLDYTDKDAWLAKAKTENSELFELDSYGVLAFSTPSSWLVYVVGNDFESASELDETYDEINTGITIGGTLYAALASEYDFTKITSSDAVINIASINDLSVVSGTITNLETTNASITNLDADNIETDELVSSRRCVQDAHIDIESHPTNVECYIGIGKFTGTYNLKLYGPDGNNELVDLFTATIIWNGKNPIVQYHEYDDSNADYLYRIVFTDDALYFVTQGSGTLYYSCDSMGSTFAPTSSMYPNVPFTDDDIIQNYITSYHDRTVFFGNSTVESGVDVLGELKADILELPAEFTIDDLDVQGNLNVQGNATLGSLDTNEIKTRSLEVNNEDDDTTYLYADDNGLDINVNTNINGILTVGELD